MIRQKCQITFTMARNNGSPSHSSSLTHSSTLTPSQSPDQPLSALHPSSRSDVTSQPLISAQRSKQFPSNHTTKKLNLSKPLNPVTSSSQSKNSFHSTSSPRAFEMSTPPRPPPAVYSPHESFGYTYVDPYTRQATYRQPTSGFSPWSDSDGEGANSDSQTSQSSRKNNSNNQSSGSKRSQQSKHSSLSPNFSSNACSNISNWAHDFKDSFRIVETDTPVDLMPTHYQHDTPGMTARYANSDSEQNFSPTKSDTANLQLVHRAALQTANTPLTRGLAARHIQMIAFGGAIGTGLFIGTGPSLATSGPGSLLIGFAVIGLMLIITITALGELAVSFPVSGAFTAYSTRFISMVAGAVVGWGYALQWLLSVPIQLVAASLTITHWSNINPAYWVLLFWTLLVVVNLFGVRIFGEIEFAFSLIKVIAIIGFIILGTVIICGGVPGQGYIGGKYWRDPGAFSHGAKGLFTVFVNASFSYAGSELSGLAAAEARNPRKAIPSAVKQVCWRILLFYMVSLAIVGCLVPYNDPRLISGNNTADVRASPFVIALETAGIKGFPSVLNAAVLIATLSVANSSVYATSRTFAALAAQGLAPRTLGLIDRAGRPIVALIVTLLVGLLAFVAPSSKAPDVFTWLLSISGLAVIFTWTSICLCHIRFRYALQAQGRNTDELLFKAPFGVVGSFIGLALNIFVIVIMFWVALYPINLTKPSKPSAYTFFSIYLCVPLTIVFAIVCSFFVPAKIVKLKDIDLDTGRREVDLELMRLEIEEEHRRIRERGWLYYLYRIWC